MHLIEASVNCSMMPDWKLENCSLRSTRSESMSPLKISTESSYDSIFSSSMENCLVILSLNKSTFSPILRSRVSTDFFAACNSRNVSLSVVLMPLLRRFILVLISTKVGLVSWKMVSGRVTVRMCTQKQRKRTPRTGTIVEMKRFLFTNKFTFARSVSFKSLV